MTQLQQAIERVRRFNSGEPLMSVYADCKTRPPNRLGSWSDSDAADAARAWLASDNDTLASAYVAERDPTPVDDSDLSVLADLPPFVADAISGFYTCGWLPTKGRFRQVLTALGIELEQTR